MAGYINKVTLMGNLGKNPESRYMQDGNKVVSFSLATTEHWKDKATGEAKKRTEWHKIVIFNERLCEIAEQHLKKGSKIYIEGSLQTRSWKDETGNERTITEVVLQRFKGEILLLGGGEKESPEFTSEQLKNKEIIIDDEIPF